jgi:hypothetical protein
VARPVDGELLRVASLSTWDVEMIRRLTKSGGESLYNPATYPPQRRALIERLLDRRLIEKIERDGRAFVRLTDFGRHAATEIELADRNAAARVIRA